MVSQAVWIVALFVVLLGQRLPGGAVLWAGLGVALYAGAAVVAPHPSSPYLGALLLLIAGGNLVRLRYRPGRPRQPRPAAVVPETGADSLIGTVATVTKAIRGGFGMVMVQDDVWAVCADEDVPEGTTVRVIGTSGTYLMVARAD